MKKAFSILRSLAGGIFLYICLQSAIERRLVLTLLLPCEDGGFRPGRLALLAVCLFLCLAAAFTDPGRRLTERLNALGDKPWGRWAAAAVVTGLFFGWTLRVNLLCWMTNDDPAIMNEIARIPTEGLSAVANSWTGVPLCAIIGFFYKLAPNGLWYLGYHLAMLLISSTVIGRCLLLKTRQAGLSLLTGCLIHAALLLAVFSYAFGSLSFTVTPAAAGCASIALLLCREDNESLPKLIATDVFAALFLFFCRLQRLFTWRALICFWALAAVYRLVKLLWKRSRPENWKRSLAVFLAGVLLTLGLCLPRGSYGLVESSAEYKDAEYYRAIVTDYLMGNLTDEQWESAGVPPELAKLVTNWFFMDERINTDTFRTLTDLYYEPAAPDDSFSLSDIVGQFYSSSRPMAIATILLAFSVILGFFRTGRKRWAEALCGLCAAGGAGILWLYLILNGRFPLRAFLVVLMPAAVTLLLMLLSLTDRTDEAPPPKKLPAVLSGLLVCAIAVFAWLAAANSPRASEAVTRADLFGEQWAIDNYIDAHPDVYVYTNISARNLDPLRAARTSPRNISLWGGSGVTASDDRDYADVFFQDDIRLMYQPLSALNAFLQYMTREYGPVEAKLEERLTNGISVVKIELVSPGGDYTGWYEQNGFTYYFENGRAVSGTVSIDGEEYEFLPSGQACVMLTVLGDDGTSIYTTDAYTLAGAEG